MLERSRAQLSKLPNNIAENARQREQQLLEAYYAAFQTGDAALCSQKTGNKFASLFYLGALKSDIFYVCSLSLRNRGERNQPN